jgi:hypothetical protein
MFGSEEADRDRHQRSSTSARLLALAGEHAVGIVRGPSRLSRHGDPSCGHHFVGEIGRDGAIRSPIHDDDADASVATSMSVEFGCTSRLDLRRDCVNKKTTPRTERFFP